MSKTATVDPKSKADATDPKGKADTAVADAPADAVAIAAQKVADAKAELAAAQAAHDTAVEEAKPKIGRFDPKKPTILIENGGEQAIALDAYNDKENGRDFRVGDYVHCANLDLSDDTGPFQRWVYRKVAILA